MLRFAAALSPLELLMVATAPRQEYFANGKKGCLVRSGCEKSSAEVGDLKLGTRLVVEEEGASSDGTARLRLSSPVAGWVSKKLTVCRTVSDAPDPLTFGARVARVAPGPLPPAAPSRPLPPFPKRVPVDRRRLGELAGAAGCVGDMYGLPLPRTPREVSKLGAAWLTRCLPGQEKSAKFPTSKAPLSAVFHSFRLIFGRAIISWNMLFPERARAAHSC